MDQAKPNVPDPDAESEVEPLGTGVTHTHTVPLCGARAKDLNRYLKP